MTHPILSERVMHMPASATLAMGALSSSMRKQGIDILDLSAGEPDFPTPKPIVEAAKQALSSGKYFKYPPVAGYEDLRQAVAEKFKTDNGMETTPDQVVVSTGAKQSIANVLCALLNPGDEVIIFTPYWVSYPSLVSLMGGTPVIVKGNPNNQHKVNPEILKKALSKQTKIVLFSSPCNPTGAVFSEKELHSLAEVLAKYPQVTVVSDEIYEHIHFTEKHHSIGGFDEVAQRTVTVNGVSKAFAMTGWRIGFIRAPKDIAKACNKIQGQTTSGANAIAQRAALAALNMGKEAYLPMCNTFLQRRNLLIQEIKKIPNVSCDMPDGAFYLFPDLSPYLGKQHRNQQINNVEELCTYLLKEAHVATVNGKAFGSDHHVRLSFAGNEKMLQEALKRIKKALTQLT